jgi:hypothetical protein
VSEMNGVERTDPERVTEKCGLEEARCICRLPRDHDGPHECECGGSWSFTAEGTFRVESYPQVFVGGVLDGFPAPWTE